jgi:hypothetical protein
MKRYSKVIDGKTIIKRADEIVVKGNGSQTFNPTEAMILADGWEIYVAPVYEPTLEEIKARKADEILAYDSSSAVNEFSIGGVPMWLDKATRAGLLLRFEAESKVGRTETTLWNDGQSYTLPLEQAQQILLALEYTRRLVTITLSDTSQRCRNLRARKRWKPMTTPQAILKNCSSN